MTTVLLVSAVGQARYFTHIARTHMMPVKATVSMLFAITVIAFFTKLDILANLLSISTLTIFMLVAVALLVRWYYPTGETTETDRNKLIACLVLIIGSSIATASYWATNRAGWIACVITVPIWLIATICIPQAHSPKLWGIPLIPWLPSASIFINIFLLESIDKASFVRFGIWTAFLLLYYIMFGLHASYDTAKEAKANRGKAKLGLVEEGLK